MEVSSGDLKAHRFDGLSEFISRRGRIHVIELILKHGWSISQLAAELYISPQAIYLWLAPKETHPCNRNLEKLLKLAAKIDQPGTAKILHEEVELFCSLLASRFGALPSKRSKSR
jgi:transcriptional regulator with XRE-family HTH domain